MHSLSSIPGHCQCALANLILDLVQLHFGIHNQNVVCMVYEAKTIV